MRPEPSYTLRRAGAADAAAVRDLFHKSFTATFGHLYPPQELAEFLAGCSEERFRHECTDADHAVMLGEDANGALLGYCTLGPYDLETNSSRRWWVLRQLYLDEAAKGTGLAQTLMDWAIGEARAQGYEELYLTVWVENHRARRFYDKQGFIEVGKYEYRVGNTVDDDRILRLDL